MAKVFDWYLPKDFTRPIPENDQDLVKRNKSIEHRWNTWENTQYDPVKKYTYLKKRMKSFDSAQSQVLKTNIFG